MIIRGHRFLVNLHFHFYYLIFFSILVAYKQGALVTSQFCSVIAC